MKDQQNYKNIPNRPINRLPIAIVATVLGFSSVCMCCIGALLGAIAIIFATQADTKYNREDYNGAESSSRVALILSVISLAVSVLSILLFLFFWIIGSIGDVGDIPLDIDRQVIDHLF